MNQVQMNHQMTVPSPAFFAAPPPLRHHHHHHQRTHPQSSIAGLSTIKASSHSFAPMPSVLNPSRRIPSYSSSIRASSESATVVDESSSVASSSGALYSEEDDAVATAQTKIGSRVRVKAPLKVYHVPKVPELDLNGMIGVLKQYVGVWKGKRISANLPYKVAFTAEIEGRNGPVKFFAHLKEDEFEYLD